MKVAIAGYGVEGKSATTHWLSKGAEVTVFDEKELAAEVPEGVHVTTGPDIFSRMNGYDVVMRSPSIRPDVIKTDGRVSSLAQEFLKLSPAPVIGVTGTKGKGTTSSLTAAILKAAGKTVHLVGNIGVPSLDVLSDITSDDIVVYELSSFQLWDLERSPQVAVVLMMEADHMDVHLSMDEYILAKTNIRRFQTDDDTCFYHPTNELSKQIATVGGRQIHGAKRYGIVDDGAVYVKENTFFIQDEAICNVSALQIPGVHNHDNACAAISAAKVFGVSNEAVEQGLRSFTGLPHRLKLVGTRQKIDFYDDSIATTPGSALAAIAAFDRPKTIILGGSDKGADYTEIVKKCAETDTRVVAIGVTGATIAKLCEDMDVEVTRLEGGTMKEIVEQAAAMTEPGNIVILSPASASFDMFKGYADRGNQFVEAVHALSDEI